MRENNRLHPNFEKPGKPKKAPSVKEFVERTKQAKPSELISASVVPVPSPASTEVLANALQNDVDLIYEWVYSNVDYHCGFLSVKGALGTQIDEIGNPIDQCNLMIALLTAAGYSASYVIGTVSLTAAQIENLLGTTDTYEGSGDWPSLDILNAGGVSNTPTYDGDTLVSVEFSHCWVQVEIDGTNYVFDPSIKTYNYTTGLDIGSIIGFDLAEMQSNANGTPTPGPPATPFGIVGLNTTGSGGVKPMLQGYSQSLLSYIQSTNFDASLAEIIGGREIQSLPPGPLRQTSLPYQTSAEVYPSLPDDLRTPFSFTLYYPTSEETYPSPSGLWMDQVYGSRLTLTFETFDEENVYPIFNYLGMAYGFPEIAIGQTLTLSLDFYSGLGKGILATPNATYYLGVCYGPSSQNMVDYHRQTLQQNIAAGGASNAENVLGESLAALFFMYSAQQNMMRKLMSEIYDVSFFPAVAGILGYQSESAGPYTDLEYLFGGVVCNFYDTTDTVSTNIVIADEHFSSAFEGGIFQQTYDTLGYSTVKSLDVAITEGQTIFLANKFNWSDLSTYLDANWGSSADPTSPAYQVYSQLLTTAVAAVLGESAQTPIGEYDGATWIACGKSLPEMAYYILPSASGGGCGTPQSWVQTNNGILDGPNVSSVPNNGTDSTTDPINLFSGAAFYNRNDINVGSSTFPYSLTFSRSYSSDTGSVNGLLGLGWTHNFATSLAIGSNGNRGFGELSPKDAAAAITVAYAIVQISDIGEEFDFPDLKNILMGTTSAQWLIDQITNNAVVLSDGAQSQTFIKLVDGTYNPPPGYANILTPVGDTEFILEDPQKRKWIFVSPDSTTNFRLVSYIDPAGVTVTYNYDSDTGPLTSVTNGLGRTLYFTYSGTQLQSVSDGTGRSVSFSIDDNDNLVGFTDSDGNTIIYRYGSPGQLTQIFLPANPSAALTNTYDSLGRVSSQSGSNTGTSYYYFAGSRSQETDPVGNSHVRYYNYLGSVVRDINELGQETDFEFDGLNRLINITYPELNQLVLTYDNFNNVLTQTQIPKPGSSLSNIVQTFAYDPTWNKISSLTDGNGNTGYFTYDQTYGVLRQINSPSITVTSVTTITISGAPPSGSFIQTIRVASHAATYLSGTSDTDSTIASSLSTQINDLSLPGVSAAPSGADILLTAPIGTTLTATGLGGVSISNSIFNNVFFTYNTRGQLLTSADPTGIIISLTYDSSTEKMLTSTLDYGTGHLNLESSFGYDSVGNVTSITDPRGNTTNFVFDAERRLTQKTDAAPFGYITNWLYNANGWLTSLQKQSASTSYQIWNWVYLANGMVQTIKDPLSYPLSFTYDALARVTTRTDAEGRQYKFSYDALSRISTITDPMDVVADTRAYTENGMLASRQDAKSNVTLYQYDGFDRLSKTSYPNTSTEQYTYDANNNVQTMQTRIGDTITSTFDVLNRLITKQPGSLPLQTLTYDLAGRPLSISTPIDGSNPASGTFGYSYDTAGRLIQQTMPNGDTVGYQLDQNGNRTQLIWPDSYYAQYNYDQLNRLTAILPEGSTAVTFEYDNLSRRTLMTYANGNTATYGYALNNDLTSLQLAFNESEVTFDYYYNNVHQIVGLNVDDSSFLWEPSSSSTVDYVITSGSANKDLNQYSSVGGTDYSYDGNGCLTAGPQSATFDTLSRITQIVSGSTTNNYWVDPLNRQARKSVNGTDTNYLYNGQQLIATYDDSGDLLSRFIPGDSLDEYFLYITGGTSTFLGCDRQGSIIAETNASGTILNKFVYSPFGETSSISASNFGYTGQRYDSEIGLYNYKARYYAPAIGRFLQPDPIGYAAGDLNLYSYVGNDGLNKSDPLGLAAVCINQINQWTAGLGNDPNQIALNNLYLQLVQLAQAFPGSFPMLNNVLTFFNNNPSLAPSLLANSYGDPGSADHTTVASQPGPATINLNPALYVQVDNTTYASPLENLAHELGHAYYDAFSNATPQYLGNPNSDYNKGLIFSPREIDAFALENEFRSSFALDPRQNFYGNALNANQAPPGSPFAVGGFLAGYPRTR